MKHYFLLLSLGGALASYGQNTFPATGNVGIGISSPTSRLHLANTLGTFGTEPDYAPVNYIRIDNNQHTYHDDISVPIRSLWDVRASAIVNLNDFPHIGGLDFSVMTSVDGAPFGAQNVVLKLGQNGNVGIGTQKPSAKLHVNGNARITSLAGTGNRMVITDANGVLATQALPVAQTLSVSGNNLSISGGNTVALPTAAGQTLSFSGTSLSISGGNSVNLNTLKDNLGNHTATAALNMSSNGLTNVGSISFYSSGNSFQGTGGSIYTVNKFGVGGANGSAYEFQVAGSITYTGSLVNSSDRRFKKDITFIESPLEIINELAGVTYTYRKDEFKEKNFSAGVHSGFIAQDLKKVLPHVVLEDTDGFMAVNYTEIIPYLAEGIKAQNRIIEEQNIRIEKLEAALDQLLGKTDPQREKAILYQNVPNPFDGITQIKCYLPEQTREAQIRLYTIAGVELKKIPVFGTGEQTVTLDGRELTANIYAYTLVVDGKPVDTKKMIVGK